MSFPTLHIQTPVGGFTLPLTHTPITIGRSAENQVHFDDRLISPYHCVLLLIANHVYVVDLDSSSGTIVDGKRVRFGQVPSGGVLRVGEIQIQVSGRRGEESPFAETVRPSEMPKHPRPRKPVELEQSESVSIVHASQLKHAVTGMDDSGMHIKVIPDEDLDLPIRTPAPRWVAELMLPRDIDKHVRNFLRQHAGLMITCGPPSCGRTTTGYAMLRHLSAAKRKIATFEQPPEFQLDGAYQVFVHNEKEYARQVEYAVKHGANVLFLNEPPGTESLNLALRAATGRALTIINSNEHDTFSALAHLQDQEADARKLADSFQIAISQRLIPRLCDQCKIPENISEADKKKLGPFLSHIDHHYVPDACPMCNNIGYIGTIAVFEILCMTGGLRDAILEEAPVLEAKNQVDAKHFIPLSLSAYARVAQGFTTIQEADKMLSHEPEA